MTTEAHRYQAPPALLDGRNILVTGAGDGIGRAAAECFATHGATVVLLGRTQAKLESCYDAIVASGAPQPVIQVLDLARATESDFAALAGQLGAELGCLHGLLHNAALLGPRTPLEQYPLEQWREVMKVNVEAAFVLTRALLPALMAAPEASVLFSSSGVGRRGRAYWGAYAVSKFAVEGLSQVLADELQNTTRIRVNCINPGATNTTMRRTAYPAEPPQHNPSPAAIMSSYLYLMGPASAGVSGRSLDAQPG
ncbi:MAG: YciK family oxidoreductase [Gammaproteobacteria bacterium]|nr:YciK family oxidoreductase [Gammaproteobacteria bacterium]